MEQVAVGGGVTVAVHDFGGDGPDLVLAHATGLHSHCWLPMLETLRARFRCVGIDCRGHGASPPPADDDFAWRTFGRDVLAVVDHLRLDEPFGLGHSCGAATLLLAEQERPGTFRAIYGYEPVVFPATRGPGGGPDLASGARRRREVFDSRDAAYENYAAKPPFSTLDAAALRAYVDHGFDDLPDGTVRLKCRGEDEARVYEGGGVHGAFERLGNVTCRTIVACGTLPGSFGPELIGAQAAALPAGRAEVFDGLGHFGPLEDPARVAAAVVAAFDR